MPQSSNPLQDKTINALPILNQLSINEPCPMSWSEMDGDNAKRFCGHCQKHVHNFSEMNSKSVAQLMESGESICAKIQRRPDGSIITKETISRRGWFGHLASTAAAALVVLMFGGCKDDIVEAVGEMSVPGDQAVPAIMGEAVCIEELGGASAPPLQPQPAVQANNQIRELTGKVVAE